MKIENNISDLQEKVENNSKVIDELVTSIICTYTKDLDNYVSFIRRCLQDGRQAPTDEELEDFCMNLSTLLYFSSGACEGLGVRDDVSKEIYKEKFNLSREEVKGTIADKDAYAELNSQREQLTNIAYTRAYRVMKAKVDNAQELLNSCKKVLTRRTEQIALSKMTR